jgi:hypothetical protein
LLYLSSQVKKCQTPLNCKLGQKWCRWLWNILNKYLHPILFNHTYYFHQRPDPNMPRIDKVVSLLEC